MIDPNMLADIRALCSEIWAENYTGVPLMLSDYRRIALKLVGYMPDMLTAMENMSADIDRLARTATTEEFDSLVAELSSAGVIIPVPK